MSNTGRSIVLLVFFPASMLYSSLGMGQPTGPKSQAPPPMHRTRIDGKFGHYIVSTTGAAMAKIQGQSTFSKANRGLFLGVATVSSSKKHPQSIWRKVRHLTAGTGHIDIDSQWSRSQETSGP